MSYRVDLDIYNGPLDLLLYLIRREEVEITDIPVVTITDQYMAYLEMLEGLDINVAGEFLVMAATLMEIKSRMLLPRAAPIEDDDEADEVDEDPRLELVQQLLEYKRFKDAADDLSAMGDEQSRRYGRPPAELVGGPEDERFALDEMMKGVELWDLVNAFARVMRTINLAPSEVIYDDTPIEEVAERLLGLIRRRRSALFSDLFAQLFSEMGTVSRGQVVGAFLAVLECIRRRLIAIEQDREFGDLRIVARDENDQDDAARSAERPAPPPEAQVASRREARESDDVASHEGWLKRTEYDFDAEDIQATEFDAELDAIDVPELRQHKPVYTDDELMGRPEAEESEEPPADDEDPDG